MTKKELEIMEGIIPEQLLLRIGQGVPLSQSNTNCTVEATMRCFQEAAILHLACHGHQDRADPLDSGFELDDGRLSISRLMGSRTSNAWFAFLSACESASNDLHIPDECLNLAAAMLYAGKPYSIIRGSAYLVLFKVFVVSLELCGKHLTVTRFTSI